MVEGLDKVLAALQEKAASVDDAEVIVGYTAAYGIHVHEDLEAHHPVGEAKFLENPARENRDAYAAIVREALRRRMSVSQALLLAGLQLQRDSQELCPVDTGALRA